MSKFKSVVTTLGQARIASAIASGKDVNITQLAVGDGNGSATEPSVGQAALVHETYRLKLNSIKIDNKNANWIIAEAIIPAEIGGFWMREMGLFSAEGELIAVSNMADSYKPTLEEGSGRTQTLRMVLTVTDTEAVNLTIDDTLIIATEEYVNNLLVEHEASRRHPDGTLSAKGFVQLSNAVDSTSEILAATPKAVKTSYDLAKSANDNANGRLPAGGTAVAAAKLATARKIAGVAFDGTADISLNASNIGLGNVGNYQAVQAGGGLNYVENHRIYIDWGKGDKLYATVDNVSQGVIYTGKNPPTPGEVGAYPSTGGNVSGYVNAQFLGANGLPNPGLGQGTYIGWNESNGQGESSFVNNKGGGSGGFNFRIVNYQNSVQTGQVTISGTGNLNTSGILSEAGQRVYSPNNPPPSGVTRTGNYSAYYSHSNGQIFLQSIGGINSNSSTNPDVTITLPATFPTGIIAISGSYTGTGGKDSSSWWTATPVGNNQIKLHTTNCSGSWAFIVAGY